MGSTEVGREEGPSSVCGSTLNIQRDGKKEDAFASRALQLWVSRGKKNINNSKVFTGPSRVGRPKGGAGGGIRDNSGRFGTIGDQS